MSRMMQRPNWSEDAHPWDVSCKYFKCEDVPVTGEPVKLAPPNEFEINIKFEGPRWKWWVVQNGMTIGSSEGYFETREGAKRSAELWCDRRAYATARPETYTYRSKV